MPSIALLRIFEFNLRAGTYIGVGQVGNDNIEDRIANQIKEKKGTGNNPALHLQQVQ
jgi:hypothetical protein|tara:strand:- start:3997 stop:4167 length:171 start_codon:yes stop_codon:yes gene_type:complete